MLLVVQASLAADGPPRERRHARHSSDELMEDLEYSLNGTVTEYLEVHVNYRHSCFPRQRARTAAEAGTGDDDDLPTRDGIASLQTTLQTTAVAAIKRHDFASPWSPHARSPQGKELFGIVASHWGIKRAHEVMRRVAGSRPVPPKRTSAVSAPLVLNSPPDPATTAPGEEEYSKRQQPAGTRREGTPKPSAAEGTVRRLSPLIPKRRTSLKSVLASSPWSPLQQQHPEQQHHGTERTPNQDFDPCPDHDDTTTSSIQPTERRKNSGGDNIAMLARRISHRLGKVRRVSSTLRTPSTSATKGARSPPPQSAASRQKRKSLGSIECKGAWAAGRAEMERHRTPPRGRRSVGCDRAIFPLTPAVVDLQAGGEVRTERTSRTVAAPAAMAHGRGSSGKMKWDGQKDKGWGWSGWWQ